MDTVDYKEKFEKLIQRIDNLIVNGWIDEKAGKAILKDFTLESEDERIRKEIIDYLKRFIPHHEYDLVAKSRIWIAWLENLEKQKETKPIEQNPTWNEKDEDRVKTVLYILHEVADNYNFDEWLKGFKDRVQPQTKQEWSEEDEEMFDAIIADIQFTLKAHTHEVNQVVYEREIDWLKSLKDRMTWRPTEEQLNALHDAAIYVDKSMFPYPKGILMKLYKQLKKLKGE